MSQKGALFREGSFKKPRISRKPLSPETKLNAKPSETLFQKMVRALLSLSTSYRQKVTPRRMSPVIINGQLCPHLPPVSLL